VSVSLLHPPPQFWECPNCDQQDCVNVPLTGIRMHTCPGLHGLTAPMVPAGTKAKVEAHEREDYVGGDHPQTDDRGRPIMSIVTTRDEGTDCVVLAPAIHLSAETRMR
jgi:hypothetical protein